MADQWEYLCEDVIQIADVDAASRFNDHFNLRASEGWELLRTNYLHDQYQVTARLVWRRPVNDQLDLGTKGTTTVSGLIR